MPAERLRILGIPGSLRRASRNRGLLIDARELVPASMDIDITDLSAIPLYNADVEADGDPPAVGRLKAQIAAAGALLIATPEYNHLMSGVLKNAIDWGSLPAGESVLKHKPAAVMGASSGVVGTARAQLSLRQVLASSECYVLPPNPQILGGTARDRFDSNGRLTDEPTRERIRALLEALRSWVEQLQPR